MYTQNLCLAFRLNNCFFFFFPVVCCKTAIRTWTAKETHTQKIKIDRPIKYISQMTFKMTLIYQNALAINFDTYMMTLTFLLTKSAFLSLLF